MKLPQSLSGRLLLGASVLIVLALVVTGAVMDYTLRRFIQGQIDGRLDGQIASVTDALRNGADGTLRLEHIVDGPPFEKPLSGWYWQVMAPSPVLRSQSMEGAEFSFDAPPPPHERTHPATVVGTGPKGEKLHVRVLRMSLGDRRIVVAASAPLHALAGPRRDALTPLVVTLVMLAIALLGSILLQVRLGLRPLARLQSELGDVIGGRAERIAGMQPTEIAPLVAELNVLLDRNAANLERARRHVANLAHGLKTPLATLSMALEDDVRDPDNRLRPLVTIMDRLIRHHLTRARTAALGGAERTRVVLAPRIADHVKVFEKLYAERGLRFAIDIDPRVAVACEAEDLDEIVGNLLDNAAKWARSEIRVSVESTTGWIALDIADDGPGLSASQSRDVMLPGRRVDETAPGYGFGLPISKELAELYGGSISLRASTLGGLCVSVQLPAAK